MADVFESRWWSVRVPQGWSAQEDPECATFQARNPRGALQISAARKSPGSVSDDDLLDLSREETASGVEVVAVAYGPFVGFSASIIVNGRSWLKVWLRCGDLALFVTYNAAPPPDQTELAQVQDLLNSLESRSAQSFGY